MVQYTATTDNNSIENIFCKPFESLKRHPMSQDLTEMCLRLMLSDLNIPEDKKPFLYKVIETRIERCFTFKIKDQALILFLCVLAQTPGTAIMYLTYLQYWCKKKNVKELDFNRFCSEIFPVGFPNENDLSDLWDKQKVKREGRECSDNLLDYDQASKSIQFELI